MTARTVHDSFDEKRRAIESLDTIWLDGSFRDWDDARVHVLSHALHYGTAAFEGVRCYDAADSNGSDDSADGADGARGPVTAELQSRFFDVVERRVDDYADWFTPIERRTAIEQQ